MQRAKTCATAKQASRYQWALYQQWESVQLVRAPIFSEEGLYIWAVSGQTRQEAQR
jgi:hypothetical protein